MKPMGYIGAPGFNQDQQDAIVLVEHALADEGFSSYSPFRDGITLSPRSGPEERKQVWTENTEGMNHSDFMVAILDDRDTGTAVEFGWMARSNKPIIAFAPRTKKCNVMLAEAVLAFTESEDELRSVLRKFLPIAQQLFTMRVTDNPDDMVNVEEKL